MVIPMYKYWRFFDIFCNNHVAYKNIVSQIKDVFELHENKNSILLGLEIVKHTNGVLTYVWNICE